jgi:hypothetical protein
VEKRSGKGPGKGNHPNSRANLMRPWERGQSGNPSPFRKRAKSKYAGAEGAKRVDRILDAQQRLAESGKAGGSTSAAVFIRDTIDQPEARNDGAIVEIKVGGLPASVEAIVNARAARLALEPEPMARDQRVSVLDTSDGERDVPASGESQPQAPSASAKAIRGGVQYAYCGQFHPPPCSRHPWWLSDLLPQQASAQSQAPALTPEQSLRKRYPWLD